MTPINRKRVRVQSYYNDVSESLKYGDVVSTTTMGEVVKIIGSNNQDGTQNVDYIVKVFESMIEKSDFVAEPKKNITKEYQHETKSESQQTRQFAYVVGTKVGIDPEQLYKESQQAAREYIKSIELDYEMKGVINASNNTRQ